MSWYLAFYKIWLCFAAHCGLCLSLEVTMRKFGSMGFCGVVYITNFDGFGLICHRVMTHLVFLKRNITSEAFSYIWTNVCDILILLKKLPGPVYSQFILYVFIPFYSFLTLFVTKLSYAIYAKIWAQLQKRTYFLQVLTLKAVGQTDRLDDLMYLF